MRHCADISIQSTVVVTDGGNSDGGGGAQPTPPGSVGCSLHGGDSDIAGVASFVVLAALLRRRRRG